MPWITGAQILTQAGQPAPTAADTEWAGKVAAAIDAAVTLRLVDTAIADTDTSGHALVIKAAILQDGAAAYMARKAPHGVLSIGPDGDVARIGADIVRALAPVLFHAAGPGIG